MKKHTIGRAAIIGGCLFEHAYEAFLLRCIGNSLRTASYIRNLIPIKSLYFQ